MYGVYGLCNESFGRYPHDPPLLKYVIYGRPLQACLPACFAIFSLLYVVRAGGRSENLEGQLVAVIKGSSGLLNKQVLLLIRPKSEGETMAAFGNFCGRS